MNDPVQLSSSDHGNDDAAARALEVLLTAPVKIEGACLADPRIDGVVVGTLVAFRDVCEPLVVYSGQPGQAALSARTTIDVREEHIGSEVALIFERADPLRPIVVGLVRKPGHWSVAEGSARVEVDADGRRLVVAAKDQIVLRCGKASITLTAAGKVLIQGAYLLNRSSGVLRIKGGSVQIN